MAFNYNATGSTELPGTISHNKVKVVVRVRPFIEREVRDGAKSNWLVQPTEMIHIDPETELPKSHHQQFTFDNVFDSESTTGAIYEEVVAPIVKEAFNGFNGTVLCYGQTSSGKTHTLYGNETDPGIISFLAEDIQRRLKSVEAGRVVIRLNLIEIYNENVKDLLCSENPMDLREQGGSVVPVPAEHIDILSGTDIMEAAKRLQRERRLGETRMNKQSSRSHTILRMTINNLEEDTTLEDVESSKRIISAVLNFVDLAGSEKVSQTGAIGERLREAGHINTSLSALSKVVSQLSTQWEKENARESGSIAMPMCQSMEPKAPKSRIPNQYHISYRDSKLTRLLQSSLAGDALIAIICNVTPASSEETLTTLRFALSAKKIQTKPKRNLLSDKLNKYAYEKTINELQVELFGKNEELKVLRQALIEKHLKTEFMKTEIDVLKNGSDQEEFPSKKRRKIDTDEISTPVTTLRMHRALLSVAYDDDRSNWEDEKQLLKDENDILKNETEQLEGQLKKVADSFNLVTLLSDQQAENLKNCEDEIDELRESLKNLRNLEDENQLLKEENDILKRVSDEQKGNLKNLEDENRLFKEEIGILKRVSDEQKGNLTAFEDENRLFKEEIVILKQVSDEQAESLKNYKDEIDALKKSLKSLKNFEDENLLLKEENDILKRATDDQKGNLTTFEDENRLFKEEIVVLKQVSVEQAESLKNYKDEIDELKKSLKSLKNFEDENLFLKEENDILKRASDDQKGNLKNLEDENRLFKEEIVVLKQLSVVEQAESLKNYKDEIDELKKSLKSLKNFEDENLLLKEEIAILKQVSEQKAKDLELSLEKQLPNLKYSEKLKEDLRSCWKDNKVLEEKISELKAALEAKNAEKGGEVEIARLESENDKLQRTVSQVEKTVTVLEKREEDLIKSWEQKTGELQQSLSTSEQKARDLELSLTKTMNLRKPPKVNRGQQTPQEWDLTEKLQECKVKLKLVTRDKELEKKKASDIMSEKRIATTKLQKELEEAQSVIPALQQTINSLRHAEEIAKSKRVDTGIQCQYIVELLQRSNNGELVELPPEIPNVEKLKRDLTHQKNRNMFLQKALVVCQCEANTKRKKQLLDPASKSSAAAGSANRSRPITSLFTMSAPPASTSTSTSTGYSLRSTSSSNKVPSSTNSVFSSTNSVPTSAGYSLRSGFNRGQPSVIVSSAPSPMMSTSGYSLRSSSITPPTSMTSATGTSNPTSTASATNPQFGMTDEEFEAKSSNFFEWLKEISE